MEIPNTQDVPEVPVPLAAPATPPMPPTTPVPSGKSKRPFLILAIIVCGLIAVFALVYAYLYLWRTPQESAPVGSISSAMQGFLDRDTDRARQEASQFAASHLQNDITAAFARRLAAGAAFSAAKTATDRIAAVELMKEAYQTAPTAADKALAINLIATNLIFSPDTKEVAQYVFSTEPFKFLAVPDAPGKSLQQLLTFSLNTAAVPQTYYLRAVVAARAIDLSFASGDSSAATQKERKTIADNIATFINDGDTRAKDQGLPTSGDAAFDMMAQAQDSLFRGLGFSGAALVEKDRLSDAEAAFADVVRIVGQAGADASVALKVHAAYAHLYSARIIAIVGGSTRAADVRSHLTAFTSIVSEDPYKYAEIYSMFAWLKSAASTPAAEQSASRPYQQYTTYKNLAAASPEFKNFLVSQGWAF